MVAIATSMFFAEMSGSAVADVAALGSILIPAMKKKGYPGPFAAAVMSSAATIAVIIPPSIPMILYAVMADSSVVQLFVAGIIPGVLCGLTMMALSYGFAVRRNYPVEEIFELAEVVARPSKRLPGLFCCRSSFWAEFSAGLSPPPKAPGWRWWSPSFWAVSYIGNSTGVI